MKLIFSTALFAGMAVANAAYAGWGAIAYNPTSGATAEAHEYQALPDALNAAKQACGNGCLLVTWEHNECIAFAISPNGFWASVSNAPNKAAAMDRVIKACGRPGCVVKQTACD